MKLNATVKISVVNIYDEMQDVIVRTRSYTIIDSDELQEALKNMRNDIGARILDMALYQSGLMVVKVKDIHMMYNKYNPTRAGKYINLPKWISLKKACINIKIKMKNVLNMLFSAVITKSMKKAIQTIFITTKR